MTSFRFLDVSGVGNSGKSAVVDILRECESVHAPEYWFEFDLIRVPGGLLDLRYHLLTDWSPVRSHAAVQAFRDVVAKVGSDPSWWDLLGLMRATSQRYDRRFNRRFTTLAETFIRSLLIGSYRAEWPYDDFRESDQVRLARKVLRRLGLRRYLAREVSLTDGPDFDVHAAEFLQGLFSEIVPSEAKWVVLNNSFEPFNPQPALDMISGSRHVVVTRDPRDIYVSGLSTHGVGAEDKGLLAFDNDGMNKSFLATDDLKLFVQRSRLYHKHLCTQADSRVLRLRFEDLVSDYDTNVARLLDFLDLPAASHLRRRTCFDPIRSGGNVGLWCRYSRQEEIRYIEQQLPELLVNA